MWSHLTQIWHLTPWLWKMDQQHPPLQTIRSSRTLNQPRHLHPLGMQRKTHRRKDHRFLLLMIYFECLYSKKSSFFLRSPYNLLKYRPISNYKPTGKTYKSTRGYLWLGRRMCFDLHLRGICHSESERVWGAANSKVNARKGRDSNQKITM